MSCCTRSSSAVLPDVTRMSEARIYGMKPEFFRNGSDWQRLTLNIW